MKRYFCHRRAEKTPPPSHAAPLKIRAPRWLKLRSYLSSPRVDFVFSRTVTNGGSQGLGRGDLRCWKLLYYYYYIGEIEMGVGGGRLGFHNPWIFTHFFFKIFFPSIINRFLQTSRLRVVIDLFLAICLGALLPPFSLCGQG